MEAHTWLLAGAALLIVGVVASQTWSRFGLPSVLLFLGLGMLAGSDGVGGIECDDFDLARSFGVVALGFILFSGGLGTRWDQVRSVIGQGIALATVGVVITAGIVGFVAAAILDLSIEEGLLLGAVVACTDSAAVFSILRSSGVAVESRIDATLELESGTNDPAAVFLTVAAIEVLMDDSVSVVEVVASFVVEMGLGLVCGYVLALGAVWALNHLRLDFDGMYPVLTFAFVLVMLEGVTWIHGSGFLAVYVAGVTIANREFIHKRSLIRFHDGIGWLMQIAMFLLLGLLVFPSQLDDVALEALLVAVVLIVAARPIAVMLTLMPFRTPIRERAFYSWVGLRGAAPIILATFPVASGVPDAQRLFNVVFFVVLTSVLLQGTTIAPLARWLGLVGSETYREVSFDSVITGANGPQLHEIRLHSGSPAAGRQVVDLALPTGVLIVLVRRDNESFMPQGGTRLRAGDEILVATDPQQAAVLEQRFGTPGQSNQ